MRPIALRTKLTLVYTSVLALFIVAIAIAYYHTLLRYHLNSSITEELLERSAGHPETILAFEMLSLCSETRNIRHLVRIVSKASADSTGSTPHELAPAHVNIDESVLAKIPTGKTPVVDGRASETHPRQALVLRRALHPQYS